MARLVPAVDPEAISLKPERDVAHALIRDLPNDCIVYHSYCWLRPDRHLVSEPLTEGEADFVILHPRRGLLVLEVKGGDIRHRIVDDEEHYFRLLSNGREKPIKHPILQARKNLHCIADLLELKDDSAWFGGSYGYAVAFPDQSNSGPIPNDVDPRMVFMAEHLDDMDRAVRGAFQAWCRRKNPSLSNEAMRICRERLRPLFKLFPAKWRDLERNEEQLVRLTEQQQLVLDGLRDNPRLAIRGGAGTGKTMLALWRAVMYAKDGQDSLFLCFNKRLATWLHDRMQFELTDDELRRIRVCTFHSLCAAFFRRANVPFNLPKNSDAGREFWEETVPNKMFDFVLDRVPEVRYDAIVVDEAQDFAMDWWLVIESLLRKPEGALALFYDPNQDIYNHEATFPKTDAVFRLNVNCRNTRFVHEYSMRELNLDIRPSSMVPNGIPPYENVTANHEEQRQACDRIVKTWRSEYRITPDRLAILSPVSIDKSCLANTNRIGRMAIVFNLEAWRNGDGLLFSTIHSFKGLESDAIILLSDRSGGFASKFGRYIASSRAKHLLGVIEIDPVANR
jgi:AAA domain/Nuclease-related domain